MEDSEYRIELVAFLQLHPHHVGSGMVLSFSYRQRNSEQIPVKASQNRYLPTSTWVLAHVPICQDGSEPRTVGSSS